MELEDLRIGCSGWSYKDWLGVFYPKGLQPKDYLANYSKVFNCVEIDSSFYRVPNAFMITQWRNNTPPGFLFSPKLPKKITHEAKLKGFGTSLTYFYSVVSKLGDKLGPIAIQLPPSVKLSTHLEAMKDFLGQLSPEFKHAIEFRHKSWFTPEVYSMLKKENVAMIWSLNQYLETPPEVTADFAYVRMVGDREITEFSGTQKDRGEDMKRWAESVKENAGKFESGYVFFNNHFAGFSPESANEFRRLLGLIELEWKPLGSEQQTLFGS
ncbi:MAG: DUF72 domain-containing protein [archaeon]|nr:MAG: DUF72 domain-containing protein [archaeon]